MSYFVQKATQNSFKLANTDTINNIIRIGTAPPLIQSLVVALVSVCKSRVCQEIVLPSASPKLKENVSSAPSLAHGPDCKCSLRPG